MRVLQFLCLSSVPSMADEEDARIELEAKFNWSWDMRNTCGFRPHGPMYPAPPSEPADGVGDYTHGLGCDIYSNDTYVYNYKCETTCQMDSSITVTLFCNCFFSVGVVKQVTPCYWDWEQDVKCPEVPEAEKYDWQCDPRVQVCPYDQYPDADLPDDIMVNSIMGRSLARSISDSPVMVFNPENGNYTLLPDTAGSHPIIISPVLTQNVGDISAHGGGHGGPSGNYSGGYSGDFEELALKSAAKDAVIAEQKEKVRQLHSQLKHYQEYRDEEDKKNAIEIQSLEKGFERERNQFEREKDSMAHLYEVMLQAKEKTIEDTMQELHSLRDILLSRIEKDSDDVTSRQMSARMLLSTPEVVDPEIPENAEKWPEVPEMLYDVVYETEEEGSADLDVAEDVEVAEVKFTPRFHSNRPVIEKEPTEGIVEVVIEALAGTKSETLIPEGEIDEKLLKKNLRKLARKKTAVRKLAKHTQKMQKG